MSALRGNDSVIVRQEGRVTWLTLNRPDVGNAIDRAMADSFQDAVLSAIADDMCAVLVIAGSGRHFCSGGDVAAMSLAEGTADYLQGLARTMHSALGALRRSRLVVVASVHGPAAGAGLGLVLNADLAFAGPDATFAAAYAGVGLTPDCGVSRLLPEAVGPRRAAELTLLRRSVTAHEAREWGLLNEVLDTPELLDRRVRDVVEHLAGAAEGVPSETMRLLRGGAATDFEEHLLDEERTIVKMASRPDASLLLERFVSRHAASAEAVASD